jgi:DNA-binding response OmpR family regulator
MSQSQIFVVDDEKDIAHLIQVHLQGAGFAVRVFHAGMPALAAAEKERPLLFLLDIMLPDCDGVDLYKRIHAHPQLSACRVIFVTARSSEVDRIVGLELGADDYVVKPFSVRELVARVRAVIRAAPPSPSPVQTFGALQMDLGAMMVRVHDHPVALTAIEFRLLETLARSSGRVLTRQRLLDLVWGPAGDIALRSIDSYINRLRKKIEPDPEHPQFVQSVRGVGYRFSAANF